MDDYCKQVSKVSENRKYSVMTCNVIPLSELFIS